MNNIGTMLRDKLMQQAKQSSAHQPPPDKLTAPRVITVRYANQYGQTVIRPVCIDACLFAKMLGQKTLTDNDIAHIKLLGFTVLTEMQAQREL